jgi:hypothetical protein
MLLGFDGTSNGQLINGISPLTVNDTCEFDDAMKALQDRKDVSESALWGTVTLGILCVIILLISVISFAMARYKMDEEKRLNKINLAELGAITHH